MKFLGKSIAVLILLNYCPLGPALVASAIVIVL